MLAFTMLACCAATLCGVPHALAQTPESTTDAMLQMIQQRVQQNPQHADSWRLLGKLFVQRGRTGEAMDAFKTALQHDPECVAAHFDLGKLSQQLSQSADADYHFAQVMTLSPTSSYANTLVEEGLVQRPVNPSITPDEFMQAVAASNANEGQAAAPVRPVGYQIQTFDGADDLDERLQQLESDLTVKPHRLRAFIESGILYNSNVSLTPISRELQGTDAASAQVFLNPDLEWVALERGGTRVGPLTRGYFTVNESSQQAFDLASFQGGAFAERDHLWGDRILIGRTEYVYVVDLLDAHRFGDRHTLTVSLTSLSDDGGLVYLYGSGSIAQFESDGAIPMTDSLDGPTYTMGASRIFQTGWSRLSNWSFGADLEAADTEGADYRYFSYALHSDSTFVVNSRWDLVPELGIGFRDYHAFTGAVNRDEVIGRAALRSRIRMNKKWSISGVASYDRFASDNASFDSERTQLGLVATFLY